jgi:hypothetical protein
VYQFNLDFDTNTVTITNADAPIKIKLDKISNNVDSNSIFLLKDLRSKAKLNNFIIYFSDDSYSYFYNTLDPIVNVSHLAEYAFEPTKLLIKPQIIGNNIYYALTNYSFVYI